MHSRWIRILKVLGAVFLALAVLDLFCAWYYNPTSYLRDPDRATDLIRQPEAFTSRATEGFASMRMDAQGYNNASVPDENIFVLMMGSSHTEALNVPQDQNASAQLQVLLSEAGYPGAVYNIGISSHTFARNAANLPRALEKFQPTGYVVVETADVLMFTAAVHAARDDVMDLLPETDSPLPAWLTNRPLAATLYRQWGNLTSEEEEQIDTSYIPPDILQRYQQALTELFLQMRTEADAAGVELIFYYHPHLALTGDGGAETMTQRQCLGAFSAACQEAGITFLDLSETFLQAYEADYTLPHGFVNTSPGTGHLNADGHAIIARALFETIAEKEAAK